MLVAAGWNVEVMDGVPGAKGTGSSLAFDPAGNPAIAYSDYDNDAVKLATWDGAAWRIETVDRGGGGRNAQQTATGLSLAYDPGTGYPAISYGWGNLKLAQWTGAGWAIQTVEKSAWNDRTSLVFYKAAPLFVGIVFDGNIQSLARNYYFTEEQGRTVAVDARGIAEALRVVYGADLLVAELMDR